MGKEGDLSHPVEIESGGWKEPGNFPSVQEGGKSSPSRISSFLFVPNHLDCANTDVLHIEPVRTFDYNFSHSSCVVPNTHKEAGVIDSNLVMHQLTCNGVLVRKYLKLSTANKCS